MSLLDRSMVFQNLHFAMNCLRDSKLVMLKLLPPTIRIKYNRFEQDRFWKLTEHLVEKKTYLLGTHTLSNITRFLMFAKFNKVKYIVLASYNHPAKDIFLLLYKYASMRLVYLITITHFFLLTDFRIKF